MIFPYLTLDVPESATTEQIRLAYLKKIREYPPERCPVDFQRICEAYEAIKDDVTRAKLRLFGMPAQKPGGPLADLVPESGTQRNRAGVELWIQANRN